MLVYLLVSDATYTSHIDSVCVGHGCIWVAESVLWSSSAVTAARATIPDPQNTYTGHLDAPH